MTVEEKNKILQLNKDNVGYREIARIVNKDPGNVFRFINRIKTDCITGFAECPKCGKEIVYFKKTRGRRRVYCCKKCQTADESRRNTVYVCQQCGREFRYYRFQKSKFCSRSCYFKHRYGERLQNKGS